MPTVITPKELLKWVPGVVLSSSEELGWKDIEQRSYRYKGQDVLIPPLDHFMIVYYFLGHTPMDMITKEGNLISCDVFSTYRDGKPIGTEEFLLLDTETWECSGVK